MRARIRMAEAMRLNVRQFAEAPTRMAEIVFMFARAYGHWEAGKIDEIELPDPTALAAEIATDPTLKEQLDELREVAIGIG